MKTSERLSAARARIADISNWCQNNYSIRVRQKGKQRKYQYCALGALATRGVDPAFGLEVLGSKFYLNNLTLITLIPVDGYPKSFVPGIMEVNDYRYFSKKKAHSKVLEIYDMAISAALSDEAAAEGGVP